MSKLSVDHLLGIKNLKKKDIGLIFKTADNFKRIINQPIKKVPTLRDITIANLFFENSTRTRLSFELAEKRLSADIVNFSSDSSSVKKGETLIDTVNNILAMKVDMVVMRHPNPGASEFLSRNVEAKIVNAGDGAHERFCDRGPDPVGFPHFSQNEVREESRQASRSRLPKFPQPHHYPIGARPAPQAT